MANVFPPIRTERRIPEKPPMRLLLPSTLAFMVPAFDEGSLGARSECLRSIGAR